MKFCRVSQRKLTEKTNGLRELKRNLAAFPPHKFMFENFCSGSECEKRVFFIDHCCRAGG